MTKVSWRHILQNAGEGLPAEEQMHPAPYCELPQTRDPRDTRRPQSYVPPQSNPHAQPQQALNGLEKDLQRALHRASHRPEPRPAPQRRREPVYTQAPEPAEQRRRPQLPVPYVRPQPVPIRPPESKRKGGMRNLIAISISAAIVGFAAHEVSLQWHKSRASIARQGQVAATDPAVTGAVGNKQAAMVQTYAVQPAPGKDMGQNVGDEPVQVVTNTRMEAYAGADDTRNATKTVTLKPAEEQLLMERAMAHIEQGDIATARLFLQHLAGRNSALGAISLAKTYDARYITAFNVRGLRAEPETARKWYKRAVELGSSEAATYLSSAR